MLAHSGLGRMPELGIESATFCNVIDVSTVANVSTVVGTVASNVG